ncbi:hypothetical protein ZWY2020_031573 [Hordeum vulgare]|nr:hypothetical protein ZWY2020_031573 [Hordeum vulgare]
MIMGIFLLTGMCNGDVHTTSNGEGEAIDINPVKLPCYTNCTSSFSGLYASDDVVNTCDHVCKRCVVMKKYTVIEFTRTNSFLGVRGSPC